MMLNNNLNGRILAQNMPDLIRYCFNSGIYGQFGCYNPHWWIYIEPDYVAYVYEDDEESAPEYGEYEKYSNPEQLIAENKLLFTGDDWWFIKREADNELP